GMLPLPRACRAQARSLASPTDRSHTVTHSRPSAPRRRMPRMRRPALLALGAAAALACALALSACGTKEDSLSAASSKRFTVLLDFFPNADHAPLYTAIAHGDFRAVGLNVVPVTPADPSEPLKLHAPE